MNKRKSKAAAYLKNSQLLVPLIAILLLVVFNLIRDPGFFSVGLTTNNNGDPVLQGNLISILNGASELVILSMGMTLVTAARRAGYLRRRTGSHCGQRVCQGTQERRQHQPAGGAGGVPDVLRGGNGLRRLQRQSCRAV